MKASTDILKSIPKSSFEIRKLNKTDIVIIIIIFLIAFWFGMKWADSSHRRAYDKNLKHRIYNL